MLCATVSGTSPDADKDDRLAVMLGAGREKDRPSASSPNTPRLAMATEKDCSRKVPPPNPKRGSSCVRPSLNDAVVTQPWPKSMCAETPSAAVLVLGVIAASRARPKGRPLRCEAIAVTSRPSALETSKDRPPNNDLLWLAS